jgi:hypothetical protein
MAASGALTGSGTTSAGSTTRTVDVTSLAQGTLTVSVTLTANGVAGIARTATMTASGSAPAFTPPLGVLAGQQYQAYSVRLLRSGYTGPLLTVRRSSDGQTSDIYANLYGHLDTTALTAFCASTDCFVSTWYDQGTIRTNAVQATASLQPRIVLAGVIDRMNNQPIVMGLGSQWLGMGQGLQAGGGLTISSVSMTRDLTQNVRILSKWSGSAVFGGGTDGDWLMSPSSTSRTRFVLRLSGSNLVADSNLAPDSALHIHGGMIAPGTAITAYFDGVPASYTGAVQFSTIPASSTEARMFADATASFRTSIAEAIIVTSTLSDSTRQSLEANQRSYFSTP